MPFNMDLLQQNPNMQNMMNTMGNMTMVQTGQPAQNMNPYLMSYLNSDPFSLGNQAPIMQMNQMPNTQVYPTEPSQQQMNQMPTSLW